MVAELIANPIPAVTDHAIADVERLFVAVLGHRVVLTPTKLAEARQHGMAAVMDSFADECLSLAPPPVAELDEPSADAGSHG